MARDLRDFLDLTAARAATQWRRICRRNVPVKGKRQESFLPVEVLLCFGLFRVADPHRYGGRNIHKAPTDLITLARTFRRSPGSVTSKMLNLDNSRENAGRFEVDLFVRLTDDPELYAALHRRILRAAREVGLGEDAVPDFLDLLEDDDGLYLLGQDELGPEEIALALREGSAEAHRLGERTGARERVTERLIEQRVRLGQHRFARQVLADYDHRCGFCGFTPGGIPKSRLLFASHIKPWRRSSSRERLDPRNGIAACPTHDAAFDGGLLTVNGGLRVHRARSLDALVVREPEADRYFGESALRPSLVVPAGTPGPARRYLEFHRTKVFRAG